MRKRERKTFAKIALAIFYPQMLLYIIAITYLVIKFV